MYRGKRIFDLLLAGAALLLLAPFLFAIGLLIKLSGRGPIFFSQTRIGLEGRPFRLWKFRTMVMGAEQQGGQLTAAGDPRVSGVGGWLRRFKIDELPQLWNVLIGDMSLVGPRPEVPRYVTFNDSIWRSILQVRPGITDPASLVYRHEDDVLAGSANPELHYREFVLPHKLNLSLPYIRQASLWLDVKLVLITIRHVLFPAASWRRGPATGAIRGGRALMPGLSLAFQARFLAVAQPRHARFGAANASERPWRTAKPVPHPKG